LEERKLKKGKNRRLGEGGASTWNGTNAFKACIFHRVRGEVGSVLKKKGGEGEGGGDLSEIVGIIVR